MIEAILFAIVAATLGTHLLTAALAAWRHRSAAAPDTEDHRLPYVSLVRPVCGVDAFDAETLASSFRQDYPRYEIIFCAPSESDPAVALVRRLIAENPQIEATLLCGETRMSGNPKLNNVAKGYRAARSEWVVMTDSNLLLPPDYLRTLAATWQSDTGLVSSPPSGIRPGNFWGAVECAFLNTSQGRWQLAADSLGMGFAQGKTLFWNRKVLEAGGGLPALGRNLAEDVASTKLVRAQGLRVRLTPKLFPQPVGDRSARFVWDRQLRWSRVRRDGFPLIFMAEIAQGPLVPVAALVTLAALGTVPWILLPVLLLAWYGAEIALARVAGWPATPRDLAAMIVRDALLPALWLATWTGRGITWRGTDMAPAGTAGPAE
ncbi:MAG: ceramide glucosyltransferase [Rhodobacteraceae bacterium]|jgi:ceramide glucosyltransferase|uniref:Ceramide glucosyltransferase n=1 Tax=Salipiger profundus TaxID=1229727 RepID=A0A1U7D2C6_9RHOB|nr:MULTISPECIES: ceramide glucosyltransferase [Salipiger]APX22235.1 ceramide glucosyltransferase [Salipiger profundus]MAB05247.1 ceramide glucosyltransferase [Paracoccaceae bacterium]GGA08430.1 ceramide glucosyltransferase [Salipiger profundus]SFC49740.1 ceramide glucosyltransferase [Salipiger profundus]